MSIRHSNSLPFLTLTIVFMTGLISIGCSHTSHVVSTIDPNTRMVTMINVLTPEKGKQQETITLLQKAMDNTMRHQPGFISANIHRSVDNEHVAVYAQWQDEESIRAVVQLVHSGDAPYLAKAFSIARPDFHQYQVVSVHRAVGKH